MCIAVGQHQTTNSFRVQGCKYLTDAATAVVAHQVDLIDVQRIQKLRQHMGIGGDRHVLGGRYLGLAVRQQIDGNAAPDIAQFRELVPPKIAVEQHTVHEQRHRTAATLDVADVPGWCAHSALVRKEVLAAHEFLLGRDSRSFCAHSSQQTSTTRVPIVTLMAVSSSWQSQAAQVF